MDTIRDSGFDFDSFGEEMLQSKDGILLTDLAGRIIALNQIVKEMWGIPERTLKYNKIKPLIEFASTKARDPERFLKSATKIVGLKNTFSQEEIALADGRIIDCHTFPMIGTDNKVHGRIWYLKDITEQKSLQDMRNLQHLMLENLVEGVVITKVSDNTIAYANRRFEAIYGYNRNELLGKNISILNDPNSSVTPDKERIKIGETLVREGEWGGMMDNVKKDGTKIWSEVKIIKIEHSQFGDAYVSIQSDLTDGVAKTRELEESEKKFRSLFENSLDAILILVKDGSTVLDANPEACKLLGWTKKELLHQDRKALVDLSDERFQKLIKDREKTGSFRGRYRIVRKDGTKVECGASSVNFLAADGYEHTHVVLHRV